MLGGWFCGVVEQEAGGQQAQVGSLRAGASGVLKMSSKGRVIGFRRMWKALLGLSESLAGSMRGLREVLLTLGRKRL